MKKYALGLVLSMILFACGEDEKPAIDLEYPEIIATADSFPIQCSVVERGSTLEFKALFSDNVELGSYSLDIHHNFDHHTHSTEVNDCESDPVKAAVNPMLFIQTYTIPTGLNEYEAEAEIDIPSDIDPGDYHFLIRVTDKEGWQTLQGISIKIL
ncbi:DUF4625 domain-containing protein [Algoriphagus halophytocola]|uniref:DUF4625 domain-containing protein n=1 Tax=Algoriphagus halophytocola TaxID=2991499 RepID=A0ABY6MHE5_9BACT|nr:MULTISPECIES: DUF4625 domain-containing protein [unclassified Algoriphagus]UZD23213.1 DUF4625 domain-containing protein [Algoriphagus sp. TR-M5]WBL44506.1 DUF4625 domain-containing protein [Algoriphagus sp. TR-M9]